VFDEDAILDTRQNAGGRESTHFDQSADRLREGGGQAELVTNQMLWGISLYLECGKFKKENRRTYSRVTDAARRMVESGDKDWKRKVAFEHVRPLSKMYQMLFEERKTLTLERAAFIIGECLPILITLEREFEMAARGFKTAGKPQQRYAKIPITGFSLRSEAAREPDRPDIAA